MKIPAVVRKHGATAFGLVLLVAAVYVVQREFRDLKVSDVLTALEAMVRQSITSLGAQLDLPAFSDDVVGAVARLQAAQETGTAAIVSEIQQLRDEFVKLRLRMAA